MVTFLLRIPFFYDKVYNENREFYIPFFRNAFLFFKITDFYCVIILFIKKCYRKFGIALFQYQTSIMKENSIYTYIDLD